MAFGAVGVVAVAAAFPGEILGARKKQYGMVIDVRRCTGCRACMVACKAENNVPLGGFRNWVNYTETGSYPTVRRAMSPRLCNHCTEPECVAACPVKAIYKREDGVVLVDENKCKNIKLCITKCPYGAIHTDPVSLKANKCTLCLHRVEAGVVPACVNTCQGRARVFGDLGDPTSEASRLVATQPTTTLRPHKGSPNIHYIGLDEAGATGEDDEWMKMNREFSSTRR
ncbi:4Fe-4S dicluster domain-containing protein [bacterium]|nr:4Fe-4S dicluster domain-containing protein [bacterium]